MGSAVLTEIFLLDVDLFVPLVLTVLVAVIAWIRRDDLLEFIGRRLCGTVTSDGR